MSIRTDNFEEFNLETSIVQINKSNFTKILSSQGVDRRMLIIGINIATGGVLITPNADFSHTIRISNFEVLENFLQYYNGELYAKLSDDTLESNANVTVWKNNR
jgi:hypothetical protein